MSKAIEADQLKTKSVVVRNAETAPTKLELARPKSPMIDKSVSEDESRPKNLKANVLPTEGFVLEIDGKFKSEYKSPETAMTAGLELKKKYPPIQVKVYDAKERTRTVVELPA